MDNKDNLSTIKQQFQPLVEAGDKEACAALSLQLAEDRNNWPALLEVADALHHRYMGDLYTAVRDCRLDLADDKGRLPLHDAIIKNHKDRVLALLERGADIHAPDSEGLSPFHYAVYASYDTRDIIALLMQRGADVRAAETTRGYTPFHIIGDHGDTDLIERFLAAGADINALNYAGETPMDVAFREQCLAQYLALHQHGGKRAADLKREATSPALPVVNVEEWYSYSRTTALHRCAARNSCRDIDYLLDRQGMDINVRAAGGNTPLHFAVLSRQKEAAEHLLHRDADANARGANGQTPLIMAVRDASLEMSRLLLSHGADIALTDNDGHDVMYWVEHIPLPDYYEKSDYPLEELRALLVQAGGVPAPIPPSDWYDKYRFSAWDLSTVRDAALALSMGMSVEDRDWWDGDTLLHWAVFTNKPHVVRYLLERGANPNTWGEGNHHTPLIDAADRDLGDIVLLLLEYGADPYRCVYGCNALDYCEDFPRVAALLRSRGADLRVHGESPLYEAYFGSADYEWCSKYGSPKGVDETDRDGWKPLHYALMALRDGMPGARERISILLKNGADLYSRDKEGTIPLDWIFQGHTSGKSNIPYVDILKETDVNRLDARGFNALHYAIATGDASLIRALIDIGADPLCPTGAGYPPLGLAMALEQTDVAGVLREHDHREQVDLPPRLEPELRLACGKGDIPRIRELLQAGADPNGDDCGVMPPWYYPGFNNDAPLTQLCGCTDCSAQEREEGVKLLLSAGANVHREDIFEATALEEAVAAAHPECVRLLLEAGADPNHIQTHFNHDTDFTPLSHALPCGAGEEDAMVECIVLLLEHGANLFLGHDVLTSNREEDDFSPLAWLVQEDCYDLLSRLLDKGLPSSVFDINGRDDDGNTLLHYAALYAGTPATAGLLQQYGADPTLRNYAGQTPQELCARFNGQFLGSAD